MTRKKYLEPFKYRPDIDGLRAIAVLSVIIFHGFPGALRGGFVGVDVFFVISGFLISTILFQNIDRGTFSITDFYSRRIRRIFPALILVLSSVLIFGWFYLFPDELHQLGKHVASSAGFVQNFTLWKESGYFDNASETKPLLHIWSLGIEEQFYFLWPLLLWGGGKLSEIFWKGQHKKLLHLIIIILIFVISFSLNLHLIATNPTKTFYLPQYRFFELSAGGLVAWIALYRPKSPLTLTNSFKCFSLPEFTEGRVKNVMSFVGLAILLIIFGEFSKKTLFPGKLALLPVFATAFIILAGADSWLNSKVLSHKVLIWFGLISYPLYLWHWPILSFGRIIYGQTPTREFRLMAIAASIVLSWITVRLIEKPFRFGQQKIGLKIVALCSLSFVVGISGFIIQKSHRILERSFGAKLTRGISYTDDNLPGEIKCEPNEFINEALNYCIKFPRGLGEYNAVVIGDSHAADKFHGIAKKDTTHSWLLLGNSSCPPVYGIKIIGTDNQICPPKIESIIDYVSGNPSIELVVLSFVGMYFQTQPVAANHLGGEMPKIYKNGTEMTTLDERASAFSFGLENALNRLKNKRVIVLMDVPELPFYPRDCLRGQQGCSVKKADVRSRQSRLRSILSFLKGKFPNIAIFDPLDFMCEDEKCSYKNSDSVFYRDGHHLSLEGSDSYGEQFAKYLSLK